MSISFNAFIQTFGEDPLCLLHNFIYLLLLRTSRYAVDFWNEYPLQIFKDTWFSLVNTFLQILSQEKFAKRSCDLGGQGTLPWGGIRRPGKLWWVEEVCWATRRLSILLAPNPPRCNEYAVLLINGQLNCNFVLNKIITSKNQLHVCTIFVWFKTV